MTETLTEWPTIEQFGFFGINNLVLFVYDIGYSTVTLMVVERSFAEDLGRVFQKGQPINLFGFPCTIQRINKSAGALVLKPMFVQHCQWLRGDLKELTDELIAEAPLVAQSETAAPADPWQVMDACRDGNMTIEQAMDPDFDISTILEDSTENEE